jgi:hypothetical protein
LGQPAVVQAAALDAAEQPLDGGPFARIVDGLLPLR